MQLNLDLDEIRTLLIAIDDSKELTENFIHDLTSDQVEEREGYVEFQQQLETIDFKLTKAIAGIEP